MLICTVLVLRCELQRMERRVEELENQVKRTRQEATGLMGMLAAGVRGLGGGGGGGAGGGTGGIGCVSCCVVLCGGAGGGTGGIGCVSCCVVWCRVVSCHTTSLSGCHSLSLARAFSFFGALWLQALCLLARHVFHTSVHATVLITIDTTRQVSGIAICVLCVDSRPACRRPSSLPASPETDPLLQSDSEQLRALLKSAADSKAASSGVGGFFNRMFGGGERGSGSTSGSGSGSVSSNEASSGPVSYSAARTSPKDSAGSGGSGGSSGISKAPATGREHPGNASPSIPAAATPPAAAAASGASMSQSAGSLLASSLKFTGMAAQVWRGQ